MNQSFKFRKSERLCSQKEIQALFEDGHAFYSFPFRVVWKQSTKPADYPAQVVISVPKKKFKKAVSRNLIRRRIKEGYRLNKQVLYDHLKQTDLKLVFMLMYTHNEIMDYKDIERKISALMIRFQKEVMAKA